MAGTKKRSPNPNALTKNEEKFCQHYAIHKNGAAAYNHAYAASRKNTAQYRAEKASKLLNKAKIKARLNSLMKRIAEVSEKEFDISANRVLQEIAAIAFANADDYYEWGVREIPRFNKKTGELVTDPKTGEVITDPQPFAIIKPSNTLTRSQKKAIAGAEMSFTKDGMPVVSVKMSDRLSALRLLGTHHKLFNQNIDHTVSGANGGPIEVKDVSEVKAMDPVEAMKAFTAFRQSLTG